MNAIPRPLPARELGHRLRQQELVAKFGLFALANQSLESALHEASSIAAEGLNTGLAKVLRYRPDTADFLVVSGIGWKPGVVGRATLPGGSASPAGHAVESGHPVLANDVATDNRFRVPALLVDHAVRSAINVVIRPAQDGVFGVLEVDSTHESEFVAADTMFLQAMANLLGAAIARTEAAEATERKVREMDLLIKEVHHRVKNSLQLVQNMLQLQARTAGAEAKRQLELAASRIKTVGAVHHRLYAGPSVAHVQAAEFVRALLADMQAVLTGGHSEGDPSLEAPEIALPASATTALGLVVTELVTNAAKYGARPIAVKLEETQAGLLVTVEDSGNGFAPGFNPYGGGSGLGMRLIATLANPAPGSVRVDRSVPRGRISVLLKP